MPFDAVELNYGYVGLCFPGVGERRYLQMTTEAFRVFDYVFPREEPSVRVASRKHGGQKPDGYRFLWDVMCQTQPVFTTFVPNNQPDWHRSNGDIILHAKRWIAYFRFEAKKRSYATDVQKSQLFLRSIHDNTLLSTIKSLEMSIMTQEAQTESQFLPHHLQIQQLADSLALIPNNRWKMNSPTHPPETTTNQPILNYTDNTSLRHRHSISCRVHSHPLTSLILAVDRIVPAPLMRPVMPDHAVLLRHVTARVDPSTRPAVDDPNVVRPIRPSVYELLRWCMRLALDADMRRQSVGLWHAHSSLDNTFNETSVVTS